MVDALKDQKQWLIAAKKHLSKSYDNLTWDKFASLVGVDPRAFKTYRMPESSSDFRKMPSLVVDSINACIAQAENSGETQAPPANRSSQHELLVPALAALVIRQANVSLIESVMISGSSRYYGDHIGLTSEDRKAMALVSRVCLSNGFEDYGSEIHDLLWLCTHPLGEWLSVPEVIEKGLGLTILIESEDGIPTPEANELAQDFSGLTQTIEEQLFLKFMEMLDKYDGETSGEYYASIREFVIRNPTCRPEELTSLQDKVSAQIWVLLQREFYESVPNAWEIDGSIPICGHCRNAMKQGKAGIVCRTNACRNQNAAIQCDSVESDDLLRVTRGIRQYWVEPGFDEIKLYGILKENGYDAELFPEKDRVDIAVDDIGMDLKAYSSPEMLGRKFERGIGGLAYYGTKWVVVPDWLTINEPSYMDRLRIAMPRKDIECLTVSGVAKKFGVKI